MKSSNSPYVVFHYTPIIIWIAAIRSIERAVILATSHDADLVTNTALLVRLCGRWPLVVMLITFATTSAIACLGKVRSMSGLVLCLWPQQALQTIAALGILQALWLGAYADGSLRSVSYILQDQMPFVWFTIGHVLAIWQLMRSKGRM